MEQLKALFENFVWWHFLILFFMMGIFFGKRKIWEYEAKLVKEGSNEFIGEVELKQYSKEKNPTLELDLFNFDIDITTISRVIISIEGNEIVNFETLGMKQVHPKKFILKELLISKPEKGHEVKVELIIAGEASLYSGIFYED
ncbi:MAG: hypothetical protein CME70_08685 [Halobacteriovorax sp.]|nr:hypothetical protein [Halobacteriovorax sp.]|tara:strand:+ start:103296 stop:103724 length:429 start_codon:yes stop_codon:yes gene_type:complete